MDLSEYKKGQEVLAAHEQEVAELETNAAERAEREKNSQAAKLVEALLAKELGLKILGGYIPRGDTAATIPVQVACRLRPEVVEGVVLPQHNTWLCITGDFPNLANQTAERAAEAMMTAGCDLSLLIHNTAGAGSQYVATISSTTAETPTMGLSVKDGVLTEDVTQLALDAIWEAAQVEEVDTAN